MDNPKIMEPRQAPPVWARQPAAVGSRDPKITPKQREYLLSLIAKKQIKPEQEGKLDLIMKCLQISEDPEEYGMGKNKASELISWFLKQPDKTVKPGTSPDAVHDTARWAYKPHVPAGRYAVYGEDGELKFYQLWRPKDNPVVFRLYVLHGPDSSPVHFNAQRAIIDKIDADIRGAAIRFGMEIGSCSNCGRRLTNRISRELGIGPICGGRMFGDDDWRAEIKGKRSEISARGEDPDEELT